MTVYMLEYNFFISNIYCLLAMMNIPYRRYQSSYITNRKKADLDIIGMFMFLILGLIRAAIHIINL